jgi:hypothetical protein
MIKMMKTRSSFFAMMQASMLVALAASPVENLQLFEPAEFWNTTNSRVEKVDSPEGPVLHWSLSAGENGELRIKPEAPLFSRLRYFDRLEFEFRIASGQLDSMELSALGHVSGTRKNKVHQWTLAVLTTPLQVWHRRQVDLARPNWFPWDDPDGLPLHFAFRALAIEPGTVIELRNLRLMPSPVTVKPFFELPATWPIRSDEADGSVTYSLEIPVLNTSGRPSEIQADLVSKHEKFEVAIDQALLPAKNAEKVVFRVKAKISKARIAETPELFSETIRIAFHPADAPDQVSTFEMPVTRPLTSGTGRQFILPDSDVEFLRKKVQEGDPKILKSLGIDKVIAEADKFLGIRLDQIPGGRVTVSNNWPTVPDSKPPRRYQIGSVMPEILDAETGFREVGTPLANKVWKEYMGFSGRVTENLGLAYLLTGDEKYAAKAVELLDLYALQYSALDWGTSFEGPWSNGPAILTSSRVASSSSYGSNWMFRLHMRMLGCINASASLTPEARARIYKGFVLPYATELMKFPGGISNMTDITNTNLLTLGLVFNDANLVRFALLSEPGLISRLGDIDEDGFSSEGRPPNYHMAAMDEYFPAMAALHNSGLQIKYPKERLIAAVKMLYERATLWDVVPNTGDCGRGGVPLRNSLQAEHLISLFPEEAWILDIAANQSLLSKTRRMATGKDADKNAFRQLLSTKPRLYKQAGLAILRTGETPETQIMTTLDYGRNPMHAHLDRNQITLSAFGKIFTHGPGTIYNAGSGGITLNPDEKLKSFCGAGSLGQNVILVDQQNQARAIGSLLGWSDKPSNQYVTAKVDGIAPGVSHTRSLILREGLVIVLDQVQSENEHTYDFVYHNFGVLQPGLGWTAAPLATPLGTTANYERLTDLQKLSGKGPVRLGWDLTAQVKPPKPVPTPAPGKTAPTPEPIPVPEPVHLALWQLPPAGAEIYTATTGMNNPNTAEVPSPAPSLISRARGKSVSFITVLEPWRDKPTVTGLEGNAEKFTILRDGKNLSLGIEDFKIR